jgi:cytochrome c oxidase cbb3-type subunit 2
MASSIERKPFLFAVLATLAILAGTIVTMIYPLFRDDMHDKVAGLVPPSALELAGRDVYQREGCVNCHTQMVRPLKSEVVRYKGNRAQEPSARYSLAGEFAYDHPFLWGSKRTGPDLAFEGWIKPSADWHVAHLVDPQKVVPRSNMPKYGWLADAKLDPARIARHMRALRTVGVPYGDDAAIAAEAATVEGKTEMDGLVAYVLSLGKAVDRSGGGAGGALDLAAVNPLAGKPEAVVHGKELWDAQGCGACHGDEGEGVEGVAPSLVDARFLEAEPDLGDAAYFAIIKGGSDAKAALGRAGSPDGGMQAYGSDLKDEEVWAVVTFLRALSVHESGEKDESHHESGGAH